MFKTIYSRYLQLLMKVIVREGIMEDDPSLFPSHFFPLWSPICFYSRKRGGQSYAWSIAMGTKWDQRAEAQSFSSRNVLFSHISLSNNCMPNSLLSLSRKWPRNFFSGAGAVLPDAAPVTALALTTLTPIYVRSSMFDFCCF
jgi:hypothetical protein